MNYTSKKPRETALVRLQLPAQLRNLTSEQPLSSENEEDDDDVITPPADEREGVIIDNAENSSRPVRQAEH